MVTNGKKVPFLAFVLLAIAHNSLFTGAVDDDRASDLLHSGDSALISNDSMLAISHYKRGINAFSEKDTLMTALSLHTNLGTALSSTGDDVAAIDEYKRAILMLEKNKDKSAEAEQKLVGQAAFFLGMAYEDTNRPDRAVEAYMHATELDQMHWSAFANLGAVLFDKMEKPDKAIEAYNEAYSLLTTPSTMHVVTDVPEQPQFILSQLQYRIGMALIHDADRKCAVQSDTDGEATQVSCQELAANAFSTALDFDSTNEAANHMLATVTADASMERASNEYVTELFENYATNFEHSLVKELGYNGYERLRAGFDNAMLQRKKEESASIMFDNVVDCGCGTGLAGEQFRNISSNLIGIDLSPSIITEGKKLRPKLYDVTLVGDIIELLLSNYKQKIDLLIAADSYIYFGDLVPLMGCMKSSIKDGGYAAFTLENVDEDIESRLSDSKKNWRWQLTASGRFAHRKDYVISLANQYSFRVLYHESIDGFRSQGGKKVRGHLFVLEKDSTYIVDKNNDEL